MARKTDRAQKSIETVTHKDQRTRLATEVLLCFVAGDEKRPKTGGFGSVDLGGGGV